MSFVLGNHLSDHGVSPVDMTLQMFVLPFEKSYSRDFNEFFLFSHSFFIFVLCCFNLSIVVYTESRPTYLSSKCNLQHTQALFLIYTQNWP